MELKTLISGRSLSRAALILAITVVVVAFCLSPVFSGCTKEEVSTEATRQLVIPSTYEPEAVLPSFVGDVWYECVYEVGNDNQVCSQVQEFIEGVALEKGLMKGYVRAYDDYTLRSGEEIGVHHPVLEIYILKYETSDAAEEAFNIFSDWIDLKDSVFNGVKVKWQKHAREPAVYMLQSNNFVIYMYGNIEACRDAVSRIIELYSVPISKD